MNPWGEKASGSGGGSGSGSGSGGSLHYDKTLSHLNGTGNSSSYQQRQQPSTFRTQNGNKHTIDGSTQIFQDENQEYTSPFSSYSFTPLEQNINFLSSIHDGSNVMNFLNSAEYSDSIHGDDLSPDSISYTSHRHLIDKQQAISEKQKQDFTTMFMATEDIVEYLLNTDYTEDIYGIPVIGQYIKRAKEEAVQGNKTGVAIARLSMVRNHLVQKSNNDPELAAKKANQFNENDWSSIFLESSI